MPLPGTRTVHALWSARHQTTVAKALNSTCRITRADGLGTTDANGSWRMGAQLILYSGPARVVRVGIREEHPVQGERRFTTRLYTVQILIESPDIFTGDRIEILTSNDPQLTGKSLRVDGVLVGSETWSRDLVAVDFEEGT